MAFQVDTRTEAADARFEYWSEVSSRLLLPMRLESDVQAAYTGRMWGEALGMLGVVWIAGDPLVVRRAAAEIAAGDPEYVAVMLQRRGRAVTTQGDRTVVLEPGEMAAYDSSRGWTLTLDEPFDVLSFQMPRGLLGRQADELAGSGLGPAPRKDASTRLATRLLLEIFAGLRDGEAAAGDEYLAESVLDLVRGLFCPPPVAAPRERARQGLLREVKASTEARLGDPSLAPDDIARAHFLSRRALYNLFAAEGWGVREWIRHQRLERARRDLRDPALRELSITDIATRWGFAGATQFSRAFRRAHGCSPGEYRSGARRFRALERERLEPTC